jgi:hypothetical protein
MGERQIEAFLDKYARKMIANELRMFYGSMEGDIPNHLLDVLKTLDGQTSLSRNADASRSKNRVNHAASRAIKRTDRMGLEMKKAPD